MHLRFSPLLLAVAPVLAACSQADQNGIEAVAGGEMSSALREEGPRLRGVANANTKVAGVAKPNVLSPGLTEVIAAQGSIDLENPVVVDLGNGTTVAHTNYGYEGDGPELPAPGDLPSATHKVEATKTEPDKNTYLVLDGQVGPDALYDYGRHFLFQGHENGAGASFISRVNLDADGPHRVTLWAATETSGTPIAPIDGSTWDPFAQRLLFTVEGGASGGVYQSTIDFPPVVENLFGSIGRGGYEGIQNDSDGNLWIAEDSGGSSGTVNNFARQPNSFIFRFVPKHAGTLTEGKLQALQVISLRTGTPIVFHAGQADADILSDDVKDLHTYGKVFDTNWVTVHDTDVDGTAPFGANALAKAALATPFKRPENGQFRPASGFTQFFFDETGDTNLNTQAGTAYGGFGSILKVTQSCPSADHGKLSLLFEGDAVHAAFDNVGFWDRNSVVFVEDRGDGLHAQFNALDSAWLFDVRADYSDPKNQPVRILAQGRDPSATIDSGFSGTTGFQNDGDNEITGFHVSNGDPGKHGILGAQAPKPFTDGWRVFYTQQHGDNVTWEIIPAR
jgi:hypothetical protein